MGDAENPKQSRQQVRGKLYRVPKQGKGESLTYPKIMKQGIVEIHETQKYNELCFDHVTREAWFVDNYGRKLRDSDIGEVRYARQTWYADKLANKEPFGLILDHYRKMYEPMGGHVFRDTNFEGVDGIFVTYSSGGAYNASRGERQGDRDNTYVLKVVTGKADEMGTCYTPIYGWRANHNVESEMVDQYPQGIWRAANCDQLRELGY